MKKELHWPIYMYIFPAHNYKFLAVLNRLLGFWFEIVNMEICFAKYEF